MEKDTAILIGAGFSYPCGIPIMKDLAHEFPEFLNGDEAAVYEKLCDILPEIRDDFELLLESCHDLKETPARLINRLAKQRFGDVFSEFEELVIGLASLYERLKEFLQLRCRIEREKTAYLFPLMAHLKKTGQKLDVFSVNYDLLVETLCEDFFISYTDGFAVNWNPELFFDQKHQIKLYKLHGSFIWYQSEWGERVKIPSLGVGNRIEYLAQGELASMMVYPRRVKQEPFGELIRLFRERLLTLQKLVVIGYSFRDKELLEVIQNGLSKNANLLLELVSPDAEELCELFPRSERVRCYEMGVEEWVTRHFTTEYAKRKRF